MTLIERINALATRIGTEIKAVAADVSRFELEFAVSASQNSYMEIVYTGADITQVNYWTNSGKAIKLFTKNISYTDGNPVTIVVTNEQTGAVLTTSITYSNGDILSVTKIIS